MKFYYASSAGLKGKVDLGDCPLCTAGHSPEEVTRFNTLGADGTVRQMAMVTATARRIAVELKTQLLIHNQQLAARRFRHSKMIYRGAHNDAR